MATGLPEPLLARLADAIAIDRQVRLAGYGAAEALPRPVLQWLDEARQPVGAPVAFPVDTAPVESFATDGTIGGGVLPIAPPLDHPPPTARIASLRVEGIELARFGRDELLAQDGPLPAIVPHAHPEGASDLFFPIFAERFTDAQRFFDHFDALVDFVRSVAPFSDPAIGDRLQLRGYFWPGCEPTRGWFDTPDQAYDCQSGNTSLFHGDRGRAKDRIGHLMYRRKFGLVLVDSPYRGGAGGQSDHGYPAWATITSCQGEDWRAIALHEIGHAFGLGDEYVLPSRRHERPDGEPNIGNPAREPPAPWQPSPMHEQPVQIAAQAAMIDDHAVTGYFLGARYREDLYRPSLNCLMKAISPLPSLGHYGFCTVCETALSKALAGT